MHKTHKMCRVCIKINTISCDFVLDKGRETIYNGCTRKKSNKIEKNQKKEKNYV